MAENLNAVIGKVFVHPVTNESFGPIREPAEPTVSLLGGTLLPVVAEDCCGNYFLRTGDGIVQFWDHETDELTDLANSLAEFLGYCVDPAPVEFDLARVKSSWIDPEFAKSIGKTVPPDGWIKKPKSK